MFNKADLLPVTEDLEKLRNYLLQRIVALTETLKDTATIHTWHKRRGGEVSKMLLSSFVKRPDWSKISMGGTEDCLEPIEREFKR